MTPEQKNRVVLGKKQHKPATNAQIIWNNLQHAVEKGAMAALYQDGGYQIYPGLVPDKDRFELEITIYPQLLMRIGVDKKTALANAKRISETFYAGTSAQQYETSTMLSKTVNGLFLTKTGIK